MVHSTSTLTTHYIRQKVLIDILQSPCLKKKYFVWFQVETITARLDAVAELVNRPEVLSSVQATLGRMCNLDTLLSLCAILPKTDTLPLVEKRINQVIGLKHALEVFFVCIPDSYTNLLQFVVLFS